MCRGAGIRLEPVRADEWRPAAGSFSWGADWQPKKLDKNRTIREKTLDMVCRMTSILFEHGDRKEETLSSAIGGRSRAVLIVRDGHLGVFEKEAVWGRKRVARGTAKRCDDVTQVVSGTRGYGEGGREEKMLTHVCRKRRGCASEQESC